MGSKKQNKKPLKHVHKNIQKLKLTFELVHKNRNGRKAQHTTSSLPLLSKNARNPNTTGETFASSTRRLFCAHGACLCTYNEGRNFETSRCSGVANGAESLALDSFSLLAEEHVDSNARDAGWCVLRCLKTQKQNTFKSHNLLLNWAKQKTKRPKSTAHGGGREVDLSLFDDFIGNTCPFLHVLLCTFLCARASVDSKEG